MKEELLKMVKEKCYRKGDFTLSSGKKSEHYVNCKPVTLTGRGLTLAAMMFLEKVETPVVAGLTLGADPLVSAVAVCSATLHNTGQCHTCIYFQETHLIELQRRDPILIDAFTESNSGLFQYSGQTGLSFGKMAGNSTRSH